MQKCWNSCRNRLWSNEDMTTATAEVRKHDSSGSSQWWMKGNDDGHSRSARARQQRQQSMVKQWGQDDGHSRSVRTRQQRQKSMMKQWVHDYDHSRSARARQQRQKSMNKSLKIRQLISRYRRARCLIISTCFVSYKKWNKISFIRHFLF